MHLGKRLRELANLEMTRINKAKEVLLDAVNRKKYNDFLDGKMSEGIEDILLEVDPFEEYREENWEELKEEILEVEPLEEVEVVREPEADYDDIRVVTRPSPTRLPFWERLKSSVKTYETQGRIRSKVRDREWGTGFRRSQMPSDENYNVEFETETEAEDRTVITPPPPPPPPPPPSAENQSPESKVQSPTQPPLPPPPDDEIKINVIVDIDEETEAGSREPTAKGGKPRAESRKPAAKGGKPKAGRRKPGKKSVHDMKTLEPLVMEEIPKGDKEEVMVWKHHKHKSKLQGLEPKEEFKPKYTKPERYLRSKKRRSRADELDEWTNQHRISRHKDEDKKQKPKKHKHDMDLEMMDMSPQDLPEEAPGKERGTKEKAKKKREK